MRMNATYNGGTDVMASSVALYPSKNIVLNSASEITADLKAGETAEFYAIATICNTSDFTDPYNEADRQLLYALHLGNGKLISAHEAAWANLWKSDIIIDGNDRFQEHVRTAIYNLYSSIRYGSRRSIAPMGLTSDAYYGHIFWDADTWILPVMLILHPELARGMVEYRYNGLQAAQRRAQAHGYRGAMYPWESDANGEESTPTFALTGPLEHHITADVARGAWLYYCATHDDKWLRAEGYPILRECAEFWASRVEQNADGSYSIRNVVGADEYASNVDDDAFTNAAAIRALEYAYAASAIVNEIPTEAWQDVASKIRINHMSNDAKIISEYDGYDGRTIKQADVAMLAYPLHIMTDQDEIDANFRYYATVTDSINGPAMTHAVMAVNYARVGAGDKAGKLTARAYEPNLRGAFHAISETPGNDRTYFMTGAGGLLQAVIFGYLGLDINNDGIVQMPSSLPSDIKSITINTPHGMYVRVHK